MRMVLGGLGPAVALVLSAPAAAEPAAGPPLYDLVDAAAQRLQTADPVAASKWLSGAPINDPTRVAQVLGAVSADAQSAGVSAEYVTQVFGDQIDATEAIQYSRFSWWKLDPSAAPRSAPDLSASRQTIDGLNHRMVIEIADDWPVLHSPACTAELAAAKSAVVVNRGLEPLYVQALDAATRSYCR